MKKVMIVLVIGLFSFSLLNAQIEVVNSKFSSPEIKYDSLDNFLGVMYRYYKGQTFLIKPAGKREISMGYKGFYKSNKKSSSDNSNIYKCCYSSKSAPDLMKDKEFLVLDVVINEFDSKIPKPYFKLLDNEGDILYYCYESKYELIFPFIVKGFMEKMNSIYKDKQFVIKEKSAIDLESGESFEIKPGELVLCEGLVFDNNTVGSLKLKFKTSNDKRLLLNSDSNARENILTKEEFNKLKTSYPNQYINIMYKSPKIGWTKKMLEISLGSPNEIKKASYGDTWIYEKTNYYFDNKGLITGWN
jgi:hypothetical protein